MILGTSLIVTGLMLMAPVRRVIVLQPAPGNELREAFMAPTLEPVPEDMMDLSRQIAGPLRIIVGGRER